MGNQRQRLRRWPDAAGPSADGGITLIELAIVMVMIGILGFLSTSGWLRYQRSVEHRGSAQELVSALRNAQQASLAEAITYCVDFNADQNNYQVHKFSCDGSGVAVGDVKKMQSSRIALVAPGFVQADGTTASTLSFLPRGSATKGSVVLQREGSDKTYTISVEGLTGRVSLAG